MRVLTVAVAIIVSLVCSASAQRFDLPPGTSTGGGGNESKVTTVVERGNEHAMTFMEQPASGPAVVAQGTYAVTSTKGVETHARFTIQSLRQGGVPVRQAQFLGQKLKSGDQFMFSLRYEGSTSAWNLTVFDPEIQPTLTRNMTRKN